MKNLFEQKSYNEICSRIELLTPTSQRLWGKMDVAQMLAHCSSAFEVALGDRNRSRVLLGYIFGKAAKKQFVYSERFSKNAPTDPTFIISDERQFDKEKELLLKQIDRFYNGGPNNVTKATHPFFGKLTPMEWAQLSYNHLNHHLKQFGT